MIGFFKHQWFKWLTRSLLGLLLFIGVLISWIYFTESGLQWSLQRAKPYLPNNLTITSIDGRLSGSVKLNKIIWQDLNNQVQVDKLKLQCDWLELLWKTLSCQRIDSSQLKINLPVAAVSKPATQTPLAILEEPLVNAIPIDLLKQLELPVELKIAQTQVEQILFEQGDASHQIDAFALSDLQLTQSLEANQSSKPIQIEFAQLSLTFQQYTITSGLKINTAERFAYRYHISVNGKQVKANFESKGELLSTSQFSLHSQKPLKSEAQGSWDWQENFKVNSSLNLPQQQLNLNQQTNLTQQQTNLTQQQTSSAEPTIHIKSTNLDIELNWPQLSARYDSRLDWSIFKAVHLTGELSSENLSLWEKATQAKLKLNAQVKSDSLKSGQLNSSNQKQHSAHSSKAPLTFKLELSANLNDSQLTIQTQQAKLAELMTDFDFRASIAQNELKNYQLKANAKADNFQLLGHNLTALNARLEIAEKQGKLLIKSDGDLASFTRQNIHVDQVSWNAQLKDDWQGKFSIEQFKLDEFELNKVQLGLNGTQQAHQVNGQFQVFDHRPIEFDLNGNLKLNDQTFANSKQAWLIEQLTASTQLNQPFPEERESQENPEKLLLSKSSSSESFLPQQPLVVSAKNLYLSETEQSVDSLCIKNFGFACVQAKSQQGQWSANLKLEQFKMRALTRLPYLRTLFGLTGELDGIVDVNGNKNGLAGLVIDLRSPKISFQRDSYQVSLSHFSIVNQDPQGKNILAQWDALEANYATPQWQSFLSAESGDSKLKINHQGELSFSAMQSAASWTLPLSKLELQQLESQEQAPLQNKQKALNLVSIDFNGELNKAQFNSQLNIQLEQQDAINGSAKVSLPFNHDSQIESNLDIKISNLEWLKQWQPKIDRLAASWTHQLKFVGTLNNPELTGQGEVEVKQLSIEELGIDVYDSRIMLDSHQSTTHVNGTLKNKQGELTLNGKAEISPELNAQFEVAGEKLSLIDSKNYKLVLSPQLEAGFNKNHLKVRGNLDIDEAKVTLKKLPSKAVRVSEDEVIVNKKTTRQDPFSYDVEVNINAQQDVSLKGFGLTSDVVGQLAASAKTGKSVAINGQLILENGEFEAYKQVLTIEQGQLLFLGNPENPGIQFKASRKVEDITVGVIADGSLANPSLRLFSQPAMPDEEVVALLLTGRSLQSLSQQEGNALANAAISLGVSEANRLAAKIADTLGIENINITTKTQADSTRVDIGTQINDRLSVGFGTSIDSANQLNSGWIIEYRLSPNISFEAISGEEVSANITYKKQFEDKDKKEDKPVKKPNDKQ